MKFMMRVLACRLVSCGLWPTARTPSRWTGAPLKLFKEMGLSLIALCVLSAFNVFLSTPRALANPALYGTGVWGGAQQCPRNHREANFLSDAEAIFEDLEEAKKELSQSLRKVKKERDAQTKKLSKYQEVIEGYFDPSAADTIREHYELNRSPEDYRDGCRPVRAPAPEKSANDSESSDTSTLPTADQFRNRGGGPKLVGAPGAPAPQQILASGFCALVQEFEDQGQKHDGFSLFKNDYAGIRGTFSNINRMCNDYTFHQPGGTASKAECVEALSSITETFVKEAELKKQEVALEQQVEEKNERLKELKSVTKRGLRKGEYDGLEQFETEADGCTDCESGNKPFYKKGSFWNSVAGIALGVGGALLVNQGVNRYEENTARMGFPPQPGLALAAGYPLIMQGLYGALGGGFGVGAAGCGGGAFGGGFGMGPAGMFGPGGLFGAGLYGGAGGPFGYPPGMYGPGFGGGMFMPGLGIGAGIPGPWGNAGLFPGGGGGFAVQAFGSPFGPFGVGPFGFNGLYAGGLGVPVGGIGFPAGGAIGAAVGGFPAGGGAFGFPFGGGGAFGIPVGGGFPIGGGGAFGIPVGGGFPMGGAIGAAIGGFPIGGGGAFGIPVGGGFPIGGAIGAAIGGFPIGGGGAFGIPVGGGFPIGGAIGAAIGGFPIGGGAIGLQIGGALGLQIGGALGIPVGGAIGGAIGGGLGGIQYQQQLAQMQQQQLNVWMQQQQAQIQRTSVINSLYQDLVKIQLQIQQLATSPLTPLPGGPPVVGPVNPVIPGGGIRGASGR